MVVVTLQNGQQREYFAADCMPYTPEMFDWAGADLSGKWVYLR